MAGSAFFAAVSGLKANQTRLDVIANNIANINTFGFKTSRVTFSDLLNQILRAGASPQGERGGINPMQIGLGVKLASIDTIMGQGSIQNTGNPRDLAIDGDGFFIVEGEAGTSYTRTGNFTLDYNGTLLTVDGLRVQGYTRLTPDGLSIDTNAGIDDIRINFGQKLPARATTEVRFKSNLEAGSNIYGTAKLTSAGSTGFLLASGTMLPVAEALGTAVDDGSGTPLADSVAGNDDLVINGQEIVYSWPAGWTWGDSAANAQHIADAINQQSTTVYSYVGEDDNLVIQSLFGGSDNIVTIEGDTTTPGFLATIGLTAGSISAPEASSSLAGKHEISIMDATKATATTTIPVTAGALAGDTIIINDFSITFGATDASNTSAENSQVIVDAINATSGLNITATANANGTITLTHNLAGKSNIVVVEDAGATGVAGLDTIGVYTDNPFLGAPGINPQAYVVDNGTDATVTNTFTSDDDSVQWTRTFAQTTPYGVESTMEDLSSSILGDNPARPLIPGITLTADSLKPGQAVVTTHDAFEHTTSINVYDSLGAAHLVTVTFRHTGDNSWEWFADLPEEPNLTLANTEGQLSFDYNGIIISPNPSNPITFQPMGADNLEVNLIFDGYGDSLQGITQFGTTSTTRAEYQNGFTSGILQTIAFDPNGILHGSFSNGQIRPIAQIALGNFNNAEGLERAGNNTFKPSANSGVPIISAPLIGGAGRIVAGALEQSNVDLASEFTDMIITQRGFQANARVITTQDAILAEAVNLVR